MSQVVHLIPDTLHEITLEQALKVFLLDCHTKNLSPRTIGFYESKVREFIAFQRGMSPTGACPVSRLTDMAVKLFIQHCKSRENQQFKGRLLSSHTVRGTVMALKVFLKFLHEEGYLKENVAQKIKVPRTQKKIIATLSQEQMKGLLDVPDKNTFTGFRNYCILLTFMDTGIRLNELVNLKVSQIDFTSSTFVVLGKGNKERRVPFGTGLRKALEKYLAWRGEIKGQDVLFVNQYGKRMQARRIEFLFGQYGKRAGITGVRVSPHTMRHTFAKWSLLNGVDAITLQYILGHNSLEMVRNYVNLTNEEVALQRNRISLIDRMGIQEPVKKKKLW